MPNNLAPVLKHKGEKVISADKEKNTMPFYYLPQDLMDELFSQLQDKSAQLRLMIVLIGTKPGFSISESWICQRTGLKRQSYERARAALVEAGYLDHKQAKYITVNLDKIRQGSAAAEPAAEIKI